MTTGTKQPGYRLEIETPANGKLAKSTVTAVNVKTKEVLNRDMANLDDANERRKLAKRMAQKLNVDEGRLLRKLEKTWNKAVGEYRRLKEQLKKDSPEASAGFRGAYEESAGCICRRHIDVKTGLSTLEPLANFTCHVTADVKVDDGVEVTHYFTVSGKLADGPVLPPTQVPAAEFGTMHWVPAAWGVRAIVGPGLGMSDQLRCAIQQLSKDVEEKVIYKHLGWRQLGDQWLYLTASGGIGKDGLDTSVRVELEGRLAGFNLPAPPTGQGLRAGVRASLALFDLAPARIMAPLLGVVYLAPHGGCDFWVMLVGATGLGKSELSALCQQHFGRTLGRLNLPGNWSSTVNALESLAFLAKDALLVVDDFKPAGNRYESDGMHGKAERLLRAAGNSSGRQRLYGDLSARPERPPRGLILSSGEDAPRGESLQARGLGLGLRRGDLTITKLTPYQEAAAAGVYAAAMAGYLRWIAQRYEDLQAARPAEHARMRAKALAEGQEGQEGQTGHARNPGICASLAWGWQCFVDFAVDIKAITWAERNQYVCRAWKGIKEAAAEQVRELASRDPVHRFLQLLTAAVASGRAHVCDARGQEPKPNPEGWGWRFEEHGAGQNLTVVCKPLGNCVGWLDGDDLFLDPTAAFAAAQLMGTAEGEGVGVGRDQLKKRLKDAGRLRSTEKEKTTTRCTLQGQLRAVLHLHRNALSPQNPTEQTVNTGRTGRNSEKTGRVTSQGAEQTCEQPNPDSPCSPCFGEGGGAPEEENATPLFDRPEGAGDELPEGPDVYG
jgi:hypothetical protein